MSKYDSSLCHIFLVIFTTLLLLFALILPENICAFALNGNYTEGENKGWGDIDEQYDYTKSANGFDGFLKHISDEDNDCFYIYFSFYDERLSTTDNDSIVLTFKVKNSLNEYTFSVNKNGFVNTGQNEINAISLVYNFENCSTAFMGGEIFVGFEFKNDIDKSLKNYISCDYSAGLENTSNLFKNEVLDLYAPTTDKSTTAKKNKCTTTKKSSKTATTKKGSTSTTKYTPSNNSKSSSATKYSANGTATDEASDEELSSEDIVESDDSINAENENQLAKMSTSAIVMLSISAVLVIAGIVTIVVALVSRKAKQKAEE